MQERDKNVAQKLRSYNHAKSCMFSLLKPLLFLVGFSLAHLSLHNFYIYTEMEEMFWCNYIVHMDPILVYYLKNSFLNFKSKVRVFTFLY